MNRTLEQVWKELEVERKKLEEMNEKGYMGRQLYDVMTKMFDLLHEQEQLTKHL